MSSLVSLTALMHDCIPDSGSLGSCSVNCNLGKSSFVSCLVLCHISCQRSGISQRERKEKYNTLVTWLSTIVSFCTQVTSWLVSPQLTLTLAWKKWGVSNRDEDRIVPWWFGWVNLVGFCFCCKGDPRDCRPRIAQQVLYPSTWFLNESPHSTLTISCDTHDSSRYCGCSITGTLEARQKTLI